MSVARPHRPGAEDPASEALCAPEAVITGVHLPRAMTSSWPGEPQKGYDVIVALRTAEGIIATYAQKETSFPQTMVPIPSALARGMAGDPWRAHISSPLLRALKKPWVPLECIAPGLFTPIFFIPSKCRQTLAPRHVRRPSASTCCFSMTASGMKVSAWAASTITGCSFPIP
uniref:Uncharacterized protein n=1 Tax=Branchiostoma floridae TaxID=7739 RepID=C3Z202_BRAFL|eukprot:XP_002597507.1 hypothetical protein BRAFLDRAFT_78935 [Branchiostoma floridae]